jgi:hypothetical protein
LNNICQVQNLPPETRQYINRHQQNHPAMKKLFPLLLALLPATTSYAQFELVTSDLPENLYKTLTGDYFTVSPGGNLFVFDSNGVVIPGVSNGMCWTQPIAFITQDSTVVVPFVCGPGILTFGITVYDKDWNMTSTNLENSTIYNPEQVARLSTGALVFADDWGLQAIDASGNEIWSVDFIGDLADLNIVHGDTIVVANTTGLYLYSAAGALIQTYPDYHFHRMILTEDNKWVGQSEDSLFLLSPDFGLLAKVSLPNKDVLDLEAEYGRVVLLAKAKHVYLYDQMLTELDSFTQIGGGLNTFDQIELASDGIVVSGRCRFGNKAATFFKKFLWDGTDTYVENNDASLVGIDLGTNFTVDSELVYIIQNEYQKVWKLTVANPVFTIYNAGETTLHSVAVNTTFPYVMLVGGDPWNQTVVYLHGTLSNYLSGLSIAPVETKDVVGDKFVFYFKKYPNGESYDLCFWTSIPNGKVDDNPGNDTDCSAMLVSASERQPLATIQVLPNPASGVARLSTNTGFVA